jgi:hypothetical protein
MADDKCGAKPRGGISFVARRSNPIYFKARTNISLKRFAVAMRGVQRKGGLTIRRRGMVLSKRIFFSLLALAMAACWARPALAVDPRYPDWPCQQLKVPEISVASVWAGPPLDAADTAKPADEKQADLVARLAARRTPIDEARKLIADYVVGTTAEREQKAKSLFGALYSTLNAQRDEVMNGIERFSRKEKAMADDIRAQTEKLRTMQDQATDPAQTQQLASQLAWQTRIFEERRKSTSYVCDVPVLIEKRLFDLGSAIQSAMNGDAPGK